MGEKLEKVGKFFDKLDKYEIQNGPGLKFFLASVITYIAVAAFQISVWVGYDPFGITASLSKGRGRNLPSSKAPKAEVNNVFYDLSLPKNQKLAREYGLWGLVKETNPNLSNPEIARKIIFETGPENLGYRGGLEKYNKWRPRDVVNKPQGNPVVVVRRIPR